MDYCYFLLFRLLADVQFIEPTAPVGRSDVAGKGVRKHQSILAIDYATWKDLIDVFDIREPMIPHREEEEQVQVGARGWYN